MSKFEFCMNFSNMCSGRLNYLLVSFQASKASITRQFLRKGSICSHSTEHCQAPLTAQQENAEHPSYSCGQGQRPHVWEIFQKQHSKGRGCVSYFRLRKKGLSKCLKIFNLGCLVGNWKVPIWKVGDGFRWDVATRDIWGTRGIKHRMYGFRDRDPELDMTTWVGLLEAWKWRADRIRRGKVHKKPSDTP